LQQQLSIFLYCFDREVIYKPWAAAKTLSIFLYCFLPGCGGTGLPNILHLSIFLYCFTNGRELYYGRMRIVNFQFFFIVSSMKILTDMVAKKFFQFFSIVSKYLIDRLMIQTSFPFFQFFSIVSPFRC